MRALEFNLAGTEKDINVEADKKTIIRMKEQTDLLRLESDGVKGRMLIDTATLHKNDGIHIREFSVHNGQMLLIGIADTREEFIVFIDELEGEKLFSEVSSPISNLSKTKDISFEIAITLAP